MNDINKEVYIMAATDLLVNNNNQHDLGDYSLEYTMNFDIIGVDEYSDGYPALGIAVRLRDKAKNSVEWGNMYYKPLTSEPFAVNERSNSEFENVLSKISESDVEDKMRFILRPESRIMKRPYVKNDVVASLTFFEELSGNDYDGFPTISLDGKFPKDAAICLHEEFKNVVPAVENTSFKK